MRRLADSGLRDLVTGLRDLRENQLWKPVIRGYLGPSPVLAGLLVLTFCVTAGSVLNDWFDANELYVPFVRTISWPIALFAVLGSWRVRRALFHGPDLRALLEESDPRSAFQAAGLPIVVGGILVLLADSVRTVVREFGNGLLSSSRFDDLEIASLFLSGTTHCFEMGALLAILVATLCYSRSWLASLWDLFWRVFLFNLLLGITLMILSLIPLGSILGWILAPLFSSILPEDLARLLDQLSEFLIMAAIYLGIIGGIWTVAMTHFPELLESESASILDSLQERIDVPEES